MKTDRPDTPRTMIRFHFLRIGGIFLVSFLLFPLGLRAGEVLVLKSAKLEAYEKVLEGFRDFYQGAEVLELPAAESERSGVVEAVRVRAPGAVLAVGAAAAVLLRERLPEVPIVYCMVSDPRRYDLAGANITGVVLKIRTEEQIELFRKAFPALKRIGLVYDPGVSGEAVAEARAAVKKAGLLLLERTVTRAQDIALAVKEIIFEVDALWMIPDSTVVSKESFQYLLESSMARKIPLLVFSEGFVKSGALLALAPDYREIGRQAGELVGKILQGQSPAALPAQFSPGLVAVNLHTAETLAIPISPAILKTAGKIY